MRPTIEGVQIIIKHQEDFFLVRHSYRNFFKWDFVGGRKEKGESFDEAAKRELAEETGIAGELLFLQHAVGYDDFQKVVFNMYVIEVPSKTVHIDRGEIVEGKWFSYADVEKQLSQFSRMEWHLYMKKNPW